jgi:hypothetical protein
VKPLAVAMTKEKAPSREMLAKVFILAQFLFARQSM